MSITKSLLSVLLKDIEGNEVKIVNPGSEYSLYVRDTQQLEVLKSILSQLKLTNLYLSKLVDLELPSDIFDED